MKYALAAVDARTEGRWEAKGVYVFYLELLTDMLHLLVYLAFFVIVFTNYGLPLHLVRARHFLPSSTSNKLVPDVQPSCRKEATIGRRSCLAVNPAISPGTSVAHHDNLTMIRNIGPGVPQIHSGERNGLLVIMPCSSHDVASLHTIGILERRPLCTVRCCYAMR